MRRSAIGGLLLVLAVLAWARLRPGTAPARPSATPAIVVKAEVRQIGAPQPATAPPSVAGDYLRIERRNDRFAPVQPTVVHDPRSHWSNPAKPVLPEFPVHFDAPVRVTSGSADVLARPLQAQAESIGTVRADGALVYADAFEGCDVSYRCTTLKTEEFITVKDAHSATRWSWELETQGLQPRLTPAHTIELCDDGGVPRLRINAPEGKDAAGQALRVGERLTLALDGARVTLAADLSGCAFPVVIDPTWSSTGAMAVARSNFGAVLLTNGKVLVGGGDSGGDGTTAELYDPAAGTWSATGAMLTARSGSVLVSLNNGMVLAAGSASGSTTNCELYDPASGTWSATGVMGSARTRASVITLANGNVLASGGLVLGSFSLTCELYNAVSGTWAPTGDFANAISGKAGHASALLPDGKVLVTGNEMISPDCELYDPQSGTWTTTGSLHYGRADFPIAVLASGHAFNSGGGNRGSELYAEDTGMWTAAGDSNAARNFNSGCRLKNTARFLIAGGDDGNGNYLASAEFYDETLQIWQSAGTMTSAREKAPAVLLNDGHVLVIGGQVQNNALASSELFDPSTNPTVGITVSPTFILEGQSVSFSSTVTNPDAVNVNYLWNFGDGTTSSDANPVHTYQTAGVYAATLTLSGTSIIGLPYSVTSSPVSVQVFRDSDRPTARFVSNTLTGYVGQPVGYDASFSTDPKNNIVSYDWDFGDGSPHGSQQIISRVYAAEGTYTVRLTITDGDGLTDSTTLTMVVLPAAQAGLFNSNIKYSVNWNRGATNADTLNLSATLNVGDATVSNATPLALNVVGQTFTGTSATKLSLLKATTTGPQVKWSVKKVTKKGAPQGTYALTATVKHASLGQAFALAGVVGTSSATAKIPIRLGVGASSFSSGISSSFRFGSKGLKASGGGTGPN